MHVRVSNSACLWVVNQRPYVQGCTELIADPSSVAHLRQNKKHPHQKKPQPTEFLKCSAALCTSKRPSSASNTPQILSQQWARTKGGAEGKETGGERERERWVEQTCVLHSSISSLSCLSCMLPVSNTLVFCVPWSEGQRPLPVGEDQTVDTVQFSSTRAGDLTLGLESDLSHKCRSYGCGRVAGPRHIYSI